MIATGNVYLDINKVPRVELNTLCRAIYEAAERFFEDPENAADFEEWHEENKSKKEMEDV
jgi:hypothetical protein